MNRDIAKLKSYPFERLRTLLDECALKTRQPPIRLSIGEPRHPPPDLVTRALTEHVAQLGVYPTTQGLRPLREAISAWLGKRFKLTDRAPDPDTQILPVCGTREALFSFTQTVIDRTAKPLVLMPNPFYQIYEGATLLAGGEPYYIPCTRETQFAPDFDQVPSEIWAQCSLLFICSPGNPTGAVIGADTLTRLISLADQYDFVIAADECYSEIYPDEAQPPVGLLQVCAELGRHDFRRCIVFHSLSKRSNLPGLRSGFVAGDANYIRPFLKYRTYHGAAMPVPAQLASIAAWKDEAHVLENRNHYREKFDGVLNILGEVMEVSRSDASFYLWPKTPVPDDEFAQKLFSEENITVLPGRYLSRTVNGENPGENRIRIALVENLDVCIDAALRIKRFIENLRRS